MKTRINEVTGDKWQVRTFCVTRHLSPVTNFVGN
jgi:hypothetical protein